MKVKAAILAIGNEILEGSIVDSNSSFLASNISRLGVTVTSVQAVPDDFNEIVKAFDYYMETSDFVLTTGGLGPTFDDLTAEAAAQVTGVKTVFNEEVFAHIRKKLTSRNVAIKESHKRQAMLPEGCEIYNNPVGTAYGFSIKKHGAYLFAMPGIPYEMEAIFRMHIFPFLKEMFKLNEYFSSEMVFSGIPESDVDDAMNEIGIPSDVKCIINVSKGDIIVRLRSWKNDSLQQFSNLLRKKLDRNFVGYGRSGVETRLFSALKERGLTLATAESCTGGLIAKKMTDISGSSDVFLGSIVSYSNNIKEKLLGIKKSVLENHGAVSSETAEAMAENIRNISGADVGIGVTGIAGPSGGSPEKPVGTVYIAVTIKDKVKVEHFVFTGDRETVRERSAKRAIIIAEREVLAIR
ncbi:competence/damage-inducible protein CinA [Flexistipes sinusarabici DSM 4947]|uniref:CinA-like protein n=1 Tax=Flexistipes sinusarabici (strain ATCC 49648 / DSM 4947 / MAS 10) TaxID=717231 RepID=F8E5J9_FLESM|nr:competence/damage-inducible protein A [Flexistipes sinusarabici]AEI15762.1 competence/damage-inducible protein CinA [Flexistipes sinusarabici DSM 4947]